MNKKKLIYLLVSIMVVLALGGCGDKKKSDKNSTGKDNGKSVYDGKTIKQLLEEEKFEIYGAGTFNGVCIVDFTDETGLYLQAEVKLSDTQMSEFENEFEHNTYKSYISNNMMDSKVSDCTEQYVFTKKEQLSKLVEKGKAQKSEEMTGKSFFDLAEEGYTYESYTYMMPNYIISFSDKNSNEWFIVTDDIGTISNSELDKEIFDNKDERLKDSKVQEAYKMN